MPDYKLAIFLMFGEELKSRFALRIFSFKAIVIAGMMFGNYSILCAQQSYIPSEKKIFVKKTSEEIELDGFLDEEMWQTADPAKKFIQFFPTDSLYGQNDTEVYMAYDEENLYVGIKCYSKGKRLITPSLRRDYDFLGNDNITVLFDTYSDYTNALVFGMTPYGVRREAIISNSGQEPQDFDDSWDNKWNGAALIFDDYWSLEMEIPFSTLRYTEGSSSWRFNCYRYDTQDNEITTWIRIPQNRFVMDLGYMGEMIWEEPLKSTGSNVSIIPYATISANRNFEDPTQVSTQSNLNIGGDAKISLTSGLNLDLTVNPDFSQVEVDEQVTNIDRFEIFFPERRQFFLENADLFSGFGGSRLNPFFSRRIGVSIDPTTGQNLQNTIHFGARLSGKLNDDLRVGLLNMQTASQTGGNLPGFNFTVAAAEQRVTESSRFAGIFVNKQAVNPNDALGEFNTFNRVAGLEYRLNTPDNEWTGQVSLMKTFSPDATGSSYANLIQFTRNTRKYRIEWAQLYVGNDFNPEVGFAPRRDFMLISPEASINFFPRNKKIAKHTIGFDSRVFFNLRGDNNTIFEKYDIQEINFEPVWTINFNNSASLVYQGNFVDLTLLNDFDPTRTQDDGLVLKAGSEHAYFTNTLSYMSDPRKRMFYTVSATGGSFFNGSILGSQGNLTFRYQPYGFIGLDYSYFNINLDDPFETANLWLIGPRIDLTFTKSVFLTTFIQYNSQLDNLNINTRFQWRFAPVSDLFIVYTDNYSTNPMDIVSSRNRALVAKLTYWLNP